MRCDSLLIETQRYYVPPSPPLDGLWILWDVKVYEKSVGVCTCYPSHTLRLSHCPSQSERATQKPTPICMTPMSTLI